MRIALTGTASFLGRRLLKRLALEVGPDALLTLDVACPPTALGVKHRSIDLTEPAADETLLEILKEEKIDRVVHMAFFTNPRRDRSDAHELESIGTLALLAAAAAAGVERVLIRSFTAVYGARGQNPCFLTEESPLAPSLGLAWARDKLEVEQHAHSFAKRFPSLSVVRLRLAPLFGREVETFYTALFERSVIPVPAGYDPLVQLLHPEDALEALRLAVVGTGVPSGALNIVPRSAIPLLTVLHLAEKVPLPIPHPLLAIGVDALWSAGLGPAPGGFLDYARFVFVADGARAASVLGFEAKHSSREALDDYLRHRLPKGKEARA